MQKVLRFEIASTAKSDIQALILESTPFFGASAGKKAEIRCHVLLKDREIYQRLLDKVRAAENGVSKNSVISKKGASKNELKNLLDFWRET